MKFIWHIAYAVAIVPGRHGCWVGYSADFSVITLFDKGSGYGDRQVPIDQRRYKGSETEKVVEVPFEPY